MYLVHQVVATDLRKAGEYRQRNTNHSHGTATDVGGKLLYALPVKAPSDASAKFIGLRLYSVGA